MMKVLIFGGTTEGRDLCRALMALPVEVTVSVATPLGAEELGPAEGFSVLVGRKTSEEIEAMAGEYDLCVDATHPYAVEVTKNIALACGKAGLPLLRLSRAQTETEGAVRVGSCREAAEYLAEREGNVLLTVGTKALPDFAALDRSRLFARVLPTIESIGLCEKAEIPHKNILALQGPFTRAMNEAMMGQYHIRYMVTKDTGVQGGLPEKIAAAKSAGAEVVLVARPEDAGDDLETIVAKIRGMM